MNKYSMFFLHNKLFVPVTLQNFIVTMDDTEEAGPNPELLKL